MTKCLSVPEEVQKDAGLRSLDLKRPAPICSSNKPTNDLSRTLAGERGEDSIKQMGRHM